MAFGIVSMERPSGGSSNIELADVTNSSIVSGNKSAQITWSDPDDVSLNGASLARWAGTLLVRKAGSEPSNHNDGTVVVNNTTRNAYSSNALNETGLANGTTYYYKFFPYSVDGVYTSGSILVARPSGEPVAIPYTNSELTYNGSVQSPNWVNEDTSKMNISGTSSQTNAGTYTKTFTLKSDDYIWEDGTFEPKNISWSISKATSSVTLSKSTISLDSNTSSSNATITSVGDGTLSVEVGDDSIISASISGSTLTVSRKGTASGTTTVTVRLSESNNYTASSSTLQVTASNYKVMTVKLDLSNSNPDTCCTYHDDAVNMTAGSDAWDTFFGHYPVMFQNGAEGKKLQRNDFTKHEDGTSADITGGSEGDVMIAFPRRGLKMSKSGSIITISMTDNPNDANFEYMAHKRGSTLKDKFYLGAYKGSEVSSKLRSLSGKTCANNKTIGSFRTLAQANGASNGSGGSGYDQSGWYQLIYRQCMYVLKYKSLNSQSKVGRGFVDGNSAQKATGGTETKGMDWGETTGKDHMKLFGLEDFWGNVYEWIDGYYSDANRNIQTATQSFNDTGSGYTSRGTAASANVSWNYMSACVGDTHSGFTPTVTSGSETTYFCDRALLIASYLPRFGGFWDNASIAGAFILNVGYSATTTDASVGARLMYV